MTKQTIRKLAVSFIFEDWDAGEARLPIKDLREEINRIGRAWYKVKITHLKIAASE